MSNRRDVLYICILLLTVVVIPLMIKNEYRLSILVLIGLNTILALGLNLLMGYAGQISLGHAAFYGIGAYTSAILTTTYKWNPILAAAIAILVVTIVAILVGIPALRLKGQYLAMATLGFGIIVFILFRELSGLTGGASGFMGIPRLTVLGFTLNEEVEYFYLVWTFVIIAIIVSNNIVNSRIGRALRAIHTSEIASGTLGIDIQRYKLKVFILSAIFASVAGSLYAHYIRLVSPGSFGFHKSIVLVTMVVVGGMASIWGSIFGAALLTTLPYFLNYLGKDVLTSLGGYDIVEIEIIVYGLILMLIMIFMPEGLTRGVVDRIKGRFSR